MRYRKLGTSDLRVSAIALGTMTFGGQNSKEDGFQIMDYAFERGVNFFDTAEIYPIYPKKGTYGKSEEIIGDWIKKKKIRGKIILASKVASKNPAGIGYSKLSWIRRGGKNLRYDKKNINKAVNDSLKRLQTDYIDLYQLHWPERNEVVFGQLNCEYDYCDPEWTPFEDVLDTLDGLVKSGKVRHVGLCNETPWGIINYLNIAKNNNLPRMMSVQNCYNLLNRIYDKSHSEVSLKENCNLIAYSPLAGGRLSGKYINGKKPKNARYTLWPKKFSRGEVAIQKYINLANKYNIKPTSFANAFVNDRPYVTSSITGATSINQLKENIDSIDITLTKDMIHEINEIHSSDPNPGV